MAAVKQITSARHALLQPETLEDYGANALPPSRGAEVLGFEHRFINTPIPA